jgi:hypothetical protein
MGILERKDCLGKMFLNLKSSYKKIELMENPS